MIMNYLKEAYCKEMAAASLIYHFTSWTPPEEAFLYSGNLCSCNMFILMKP